MAEGQDGWLLPLLLGPVLSPQYWARCSCEPHWQNVDMPVPLLPAAKSFHCSSGSSYILPNNGQGIISS